MIPADPRDAEVAEDTRALLFPSQPIAWRCHACQLVYAQPELHRAHCPAHSLVVTQRNRGKSPIRGLRIPPGTDARCRCGWTWYTNSMTPSGGGRKAAKEAFKSHLEGN